MLVNNNNITICCLNIDTRIVAKNIAVHRCIVAALVIRCKLLFFGHHSFIKSKTQTAVYVAKASLCKVGWFTTFIIAVCVLCSIICKPKVRVKVSVSFR